MNKVYGLIKEFTPIRGDRTRLIISYNYKPEPDDIHATWCSVYFYKKLHLWVTKEDMKAAILEDIDNEVKRLIVETMTWEGHKVWLSIENQLNYKNAADNALLTDGKTLPVTFRFGDGVTPEYHTFNTVEELDDFWMACTKHITDSLAYGWEIKDNINWADYGFVESNENETNE